MGLNTISSQYDFGIVSGILTKITTISTITPHDSIPTVTNITVNGTPVIPDKTVYYPNGTITVCQPIQRLSMSQTDKFLMKTVRL